MWIKSSVAVVLLATAVSGFAAETIEETAGGFRYGGSDHLIVANRRDQNDTEAPANNFMLHEMKVLGQWENYSLALDWTNKLSVGESTLRKPQIPFTLEKTTVSADWTQWDLKLGDSHQELGRGIALSLYRDDVFGLDNTIQGAALHFHPAGFDITGFGGRVHEMISPVALNPQDNTVLTRNVWIAGGTAQLTVDKDSKVSGHYVAALSSPFDHSFGKTLWQTAGATASLDNVLGFADAYLEGNVLLSQSILNGTSVASPVGFGNYASLTWASAPWKVKWEAKDYRNDNFEFRRPPTLEDDIIVTLNTVDVTGTRLNVDRQIESLGATVSGSFLLADDRILVGTVSHGVIGTKVKLPGKAELEVRGGYRWVPNRNNIAHAIVKAKLPTWRGQAVELQARKQYSNLYLDVLPSQEDRNIFNLTYTFSDALTTSLGYEYMPTNDPSQGQNFFNVSGTYKTGALVAKGLVGQTSGGPLCSGGVCRQVPPFTGAMIETSYSF